LPKVSQSSEFCVASLAWLAESLKSLPELPARLSDQNDALHDLLNFGYFFWMGVLRTDVRGHDEILAVG